MLPQDSMQVFNLSVNLAHLVFSSAQEQIYFFSWETHEVAGLHSVVLWKKNTYHSHHSEIILTVRNRSKQTGWETSGLSSNISHSHSGLYALGNTPFPSSIPITQLFPTSLCLSSSSLFLSLYSNTTNRSNPSMFQPFQWFNYLHVYVDLSYFSILFTFRVRIKHLS